MSNNCDFTSIVLETCLIVPNLMQWCEECDGVHMRLSVYEAE